ncbi:MAG TPA: pyrroline-5-carboxylate reductase [Alphaproteobacteria bacterium]|nr:pyrroline-5-carboxylate reductase [Alphaproteobacteria bacterium]
MARERAALLLVGCGKMGGAMLAGWLDRKVVDRVVVVEPAAAATMAFKDRLGVSVHADLEAAGTFAPDVVVFATKPQGMEKLVPAYRRFAGRGTLFLSIAAGRTIAFFEQHLGAVPVIRAMPNTPAQIGRGISAACANRHVDAAQRTLTESLLSAVGEVGWVEDEALIDAVTAVSGSGPAYVFLLAECLAEAAEAAGLPRELATRLARATVSGAGELLHRSGESAATLRQNVTSPGGTTQAALDVLMADDGLRPLMVKAVAAAARRSRELAG